MQLPAPQAVRHHGPAVRERTVPHRPHHGVHPGRHLGALPADAGARGALRLRRRHARRADHAEGGERRRHAAASWSRASPRRGRRRSTASASASTTGIRPTRPRTSSCRRTSTASSRRAGLIDTKHDRAVLRPGEGDVPAGPLHQGRVPEVRHEGPVRRRLRELQHAQRADRSQESVLDADRRDAGARASEHLFFRLSDPACVAFLREWALGDRLQPEVANKAREWLEATATRRSPTGTSRATRPTSASRSRTRRASTSTCGSTRRSATSRASRRISRSRGIDFAAFLADPGVEQIHFIGKDIIYFHTLFWPAMLEFAGAPYKVPDNVYVHGFITVSGEKMSKSRGTGISPDVYLDLGLEPRVAALLPRGEAQRRASRTSTSIRTTSSRASTATSSASTSTSRAVRRRFSRGISTACSPRPPRPRTNARTGSR